MTVERRAAQSATLSGLALLAGASAAIAQPGETWHIDPTHDWVLNLAEGSVLVVSTAAVVILATLLVRHGRTLLDANAKWLLLLGLGVLPLFVLVGANGIILTRSKTVDSCGTCHVMKPFIDDLRDPKSENLAAIHYKNRFIPEHQCYTCHSSYGIFGDVSAKAKGVGHLIHYYRDDYARPIRHTGPFDQTHCLKCHGESARFLECEEHKGEEFWPELKSGQTTCFDCHGRAHPDFGATADPASGSKAEPGTEDGK